MNRVSRIRPARSRPNRPKGFTYRGLLFAIPIVVAIPLIAWLGLPNFSASSEEAGPMMHVVGRGEFIHDITDRGNVESAENVEIRCEVESHGAGTMILWVIPEGTHVTPDPDWKQEDHPGEDPPDLLARLDSSALEDRLLQQQIVCNSSKAAVIQAENNLETAKISKQEYSEGTYQEQKQKFEGDIYLARENLERSQKDLDDSRLLHAKGFMSDRELQADELEYERSKIELEKAKTALEVLEKYTKPKMALQLEGAIKTAGARLDSEEKSHNLDLDKLAEVEEQIAKCTIRAPQRGQVVYANVTGHRGSSETIIEEGVMIRERQTILRLPDPRNMQVKAKINEARVAMVEVGMPASIELDAFPNLALKGTVEKLNEYPLPSGWWSGNVKEYETVVRINDFPEDLEMRPGMTAEVKIRVERLSDQLLVPVQAVLEHGGKYYCGFREGDDWEAREVQIGSTNDKEIVIRNGLEEGEQVVMGAALYRDKLGLPELPPEAKTAAASPGEGSRPRPKQQTADAGAAARPNPTQILQRFDRNGDGRLDNDEIPESMRGNLAAADANGDGAIDLEELGAILSQLAQPSGARPKPPAGPGADAAGGQPRPKGQAGGPKARPKGGAGVQGVRP